MQFVYIDAGHPPEDLPLQPSLNTHASHLHSTVSLQVIAVLQPDHHHRRSTQYTDFETGARLVDA
jgi:hypothetical protein